MPRKKCQPNKRNNQWFSDCPTRSKKLRKPSKSMDPSDGIILQVEFSQSEYPNRLGNIVITFDKEDKNLTSEFLIKFKPESICYILLEETNARNKVEEKVLRATCKTPYDVLQHLSSMKIFHFVIKSCTLMSGEIIINVYLNSSKFISLKNASEPFFNHQRNKMYRLLQFFLKIEFDEYEENYLYDEEQVAKIYNCISNCYDSKLTASSIFHDSLIPKLRPYQCQAVSWMLKREQENSSNISEVDLHELFMAITLPDGHIVYFHKYGGYFVDQKYVPENSCKGGLLADEMGLGKTLEVLACILLNPRNSVEIQSSKVYPQEQIKNRVLANKSLNLKPGQKRKTPIYYGESDDEFRSEAEITDFTEDSDHFGCVCGTENNAYKKKGFMPTVICITCNVIQHAECVMYKSDISAEEYICPFCWVDNTDLLPSPATLIISPASIIYQWEQEISRHVKKNSLKVFMYQGVENQKFVNPSYLANHDIVLVSYETLRKELDHVDVPYGSAGHSLRYPKKFITIPSPMCCVQWWRICLDEAQMVETVSSKIAKMAGKLHCINRWCVTGTPIKKSIEDLYGLFLFLEVKPYQEKVWWKEAVWKPFVAGNVEPLSSILSQIAWGTMKYQVFDQIGLPDLKEITHKLEFSPIERVYYLKQHLLCKRDFMEKINKFDSLDVKLCFMDRHALSKVMFPLRRLQLICCHFQITRESTEVQKLSKMTTTELLAHLLRTTTYECEDVHRKLIMAMNGLAGIYVIQKEFANSVETYEKVLQSIEDNKLNIRTDVTQHIHASYHLSNVLSMCEKREENIVSKFTQLDLNAKVDELSQTYIEKYKAMLDICKENINDINDEISEIMTKFKLKRVEFPVSAWWSAIFESVLIKKRKEFLGKLTEILENAPGKSYLRNELSCAKSFSGISFSGFLSKMFEMSKDLHDTRQNLKIKIKAISSEPTVSILKSAISCHLRPVDKSPKCVYCEAEDIFKSYETKLFRFDETKENHSEETVCFINSRRGTHADSDLELILKFVLNYSRRACKDTASEKLAYFTQCAEDGSNELKLIEALKKEFKVLRNVWKKSCDYVSQKDEIEMAKIAARLPFPGEKLPNSPLPYILLPTEVQLKKVQYHSDIIAFQFELRKKLGQLFYLQNLEKAENKNAPFEESCPICQQIFENSWSVLQCGHCLCLLCIEQLLSSKSNFTNSLGFICQGIRCPLCRQFTAASDVYFIENNKKEVVEEEEEEDIVIKGFYSTKVNAVVKCLLQINKKDPEAKSLVFSSFMYFLYILENALKENDIKCFNFCRRKRFQDELEQFKHSKDVNTLLIPCNFGCNGLNITEATNVLLLEPILDNSKHLQAIGRVHRIGQNKTATVHRFVVCKTIEESIYDVMKESHTKEKIKQSDLTLQSLKDVFKET